MVERPLCMRQARGSMPLSSTLGVARYAYEDEDEWGSRSAIGGYDVCSCVSRRPGDVAQMVERVLSMHEAMGSMPIFSTT